MAVAIDAGLRRTSVACALDSLTIRLHAGACSAEAEGTAGTVSLFASGLSGADAAAAQSERAFVNQSAHLRCTQAAHTPMSKLNSHGNAVGDFQNRWNTR